MSALRYPFLFGWLCKCSHISISAGKNVSVVRLVFSLMYFFVARLCASLDIFTTPKKLLCDCLAYKYCHECHSNYKNVI